MTTSASLIYAAKLNIDIKRGDTSSIAVTFTNPNDSGNPLNLSGFTDLTMQVRRTPNDNTVLLTLTIGSGLAVSGTNNETLTIKLDDGGNLNPDQTFIYDVQGFMNTSEPRTILEGRIKVASDVTRL